MAVSIKTQPTFTFGDPAPLPIRGFIQGGLGHRNYDITPDGKRFIMVFPSQSDSRSRREIRVVLNWFEELKQRVSVH